MKNFIQPGDVVTVTAPYTVQSGAGVLVGSLFGVASSAATNTTPVEIATTGVFDLAKTPSQAWTVGVRIYWDNTTRLTTTAVASNPLIGVAMLAVGASAGETTGRVLLSAAFTV